MPHLVKENMNVNQTHWQGLKKKHNCAIISS